MLKIPFYFSSAAVVTRLEDSGKERGKCITTCGVKSQESGSPPKPTVPELHDM